MPWAAANSAALAALRDPTATTSASGSSRRSSTMAAAMPPVPTMPQRTVLLVLMDSSSAPDQPARAPRRDQRPDGLGTGGDPLGQADPVGVGRQLHEEPPHQRQQDDSG